MKCLEIVYWLTLSFYLGGRQTRLNTSVLDKISWPAKEEDLPYCIRVFNAFKILGGDKSPIELGVTSVPLP